MSEWCSYDRIAAQYDGIWGRRFGAIAAQVWARIELRPGDRVLDVGTGTGLVPRALGERAVPLAGVVGCDRSLGMLSRARVAMPALRVVAGDAMSLPFAAARFDVVTAGFLLSHVPDRERALAEIQRVLKPAGQLVVTSWTPVTDACNEVWADLLAEAVPRETIQRGVARVAPGEEFLGKPANVESTLTGSGFVSVAARTVETEYDFSLDEFLADRGLSASGRFVRDALGPDGWDRLVAEARSRLRQSFGERVRFSRGVVFGVARRPAPA